MTDANNLRKMAADAFKAALETIAPDRMVTTHVRLEGNHLYTRDAHVDLTHVDRIRVVSIGKAADPLVVGLEAVLGDRIEGGLVLSNAFFDNLPDKYRCFECTHPLPVQANIEAADAVLELVGDCGENDLVICLISGGGSSILCRPAAGITVEEKADTVDKLMKAGAPIHELNAVRKHLSRVKGGQLLKAIAPAKALALYLSDVPGDELGVIASGPTAPDRSTFTDALAVIENYGQLDKIPASVVNHLRDGAHGKIPETLKPEDPALDNCENVLLGSNADMLRSLEAEFRRRGCWTLVEPEHFQGFAKDFGRQLAEKARTLSERLTPQERPYVFLRGGETTVNVVGDGLGGRNTETVLAAAMALDGVEECCILSAGTDGKDGPTDAAGAVADKSSIERAQKVGIDPAALLERNDSYRFFEPLEDLIITGPTGTNLMDVIAVVVGTKDG